VIPQWVGVFWRCGETSPATRADCDLSFLSVALSNICGATLRSHATRPDETPANRFAAEELLPRLLTIARSLQKMVPALRYQAETSVFSKHVPLSIVPPAPDTSPVEIPPVQ
jgi:hypothetical protein